MLTASRPALLIIDMQIGFADPYWGMRNNATAEIHAARLLAAFRQAALPVIMVQHISKEADSPLRADRPGSALMPVFVPVAGEPVFTKSVNSAFIGTGLADHLQAHALSELVIVGLTTDHCVSTSTRMAANLGFTATVVADATATFDRTGYDGARYAADTVHQLALASLHGEFATVRLTDQVLAALPA